MAKLLCMYCKKKYNSSHESDKCTKCEEQLNYILTKMINKNENINKIKTNGE